MDNNSRIRNVKVFITQPVETDRKDFLLSFSRARDAGARRLLLRGHHVVPGSYDVCKHHPRTVRDIARGVRRFTVSVNILA
jgi:hypothetical protein